MRIAGGRWAVALSGAVLVHAGVAAAILWQLPQSGAVSAGMGGVEVSLGSAGGAPGGEARPVAEVAEAETVEPDETAATAPPPVETTVEPPETAPTEPVETEAAELRETPVEPVSFESATPVEVVEVPPIEGAGDATKKQPVVEETQADEPEPANETLPPEEVTAMAVTIPPPPRPKPRPPARPRPVTGPEPVREPVEERAVKVESSTAGVGGKAGTETSLEAGSADASSGGGIPGATADYMTVLQTWLEKHKQYPHGAQVRKQEGIAQLYFVMDRDGRVIEHQLRRSSGYELLDQEVTAMIERAQPLPKMPEDMGSARLKIVVPVRFSLR